MSRRTPYRFHARPMAHRNTLVRAARGRFGNPLSKRGRRIVVHQDPFSPPEDWHDPVHTEQRSEDYQIIVQSAGRGYHHVVTPAEIRARLSRLPAAMIKPLNVVQLSRLTRKKRSYSCYGLQWGQSIYLYPMENDLIEHYLAPPTPGELNEARMYGGRWEQVASNRWRLCWTPKAIKDFYLNNVLIHELGHVLDDRNSNARDRERYAEWFAIHHGYLPSRSERCLPSRRNFPHRHHAKGA